MKESLVMTSGHPPLASARGETLYLVRQENDDREVRDDSSFLKAQKAYDNIWEMKLIYCGLASRWYDEVRGRDDFKIL